jgi:anti-sigma regulatory factor (Ser/Thr protein kinase)
MIVVRAGWVASLRTRAVSASGSRRGHLGKHKAMPDPLELLSLDLPCDHDAPATVRRAFGDAVSGCERLEDGILVASELVTNAVLHSGCAEHDRIQVFARVLDDGLLISVHDPGITREEANPRRSAPPPATEPTPGSGGSTGAPARLAVAETQAGGWGLRIVDQLARRWGAVRQDGYCVWAELALPS